MKNSSQVRLFEAKSYREYLNAVVAAEREAGKNASLKTVSERLGIGLSSFKMILDGSRNLTIRNIHFIALGLNFVAKEREYFESMVLRDQAEDDGLRTYYNGKMKQIRAEQKARRFRTTHSAVMKSWYVPAFLIYLLDVEQININGLDDECFERAAKVFKIAKKTLKEIFSDLTNTGLISQSSDCKYHIVFERVNGSLTKMRYMKEVFAECTRRLNTEFDNPLALFSAQTLSVPTELIPGFYNEMKELIERYMSYDSTGANLEILQIGIQAIPLISS